MQRPRVALVCLALLGCNRRPSGASPEPSATGDRQAPQATAADAQTAPARPSVDASAAPAVPVRAIVRIRNIDTVPLHILTNPDLNEMIKVHRLNVSEGTSDRAAQFADGTRVSFFVIGQMPMCASDAGAGYGGLGQPGAIDLAPNQAVEVARWDGTQREEVLDPQRGVCARESVPTPGRYRFSLDQPQLEGRPVCTRVMLRVPVSVDGGGPAEVELRCRNAPRDAGAPRAPAAE
ncbi:MAG: hypothetical protein JNK72_03095 [Myxococcales bacterium]|nr:hypothetical protein [Myxococcales bacterium]